MRTSRWMLALAGLLPVMVSACGTKVDGQLMVAVQTDMSLPKDIDRIRIEVLRASTGGVIFQNDYFKFGNGEDAAIRLPATLGIIAAEDASEAVKIRVIASHGLEEKTKVKVLREVVTTVPTDRTATLPIAIEFLCDSISGAVERDANGQIKRDPSGNVLVENTCGGDLTCVAGTCKPSAVPEAMLPTFEVGKVFGGGTGTGDGTCFDVANCFDGGTDVKLDLDTFVDDSTPCQAQVDVSDKINVALRTEGAGICGKSGCFVALNADSDTGWKPGSSGKILLPAGVCERAKKGEGIGVVAAPVGEGTCQKKQLSIPTCGPWSAVGGNDQAPPDPKLPTVIATGQSNPLSLFVARGKVYWTSRGTFDDQGIPKSDGAIKAAPIDGGQPTVIAAGQASPHGLAGDGEQFLLWTNASDGTIQWAPFLDDKAAAPTAGKALISGRLQPEGIAVFSTGAQQLSVYWTELASNKVFHVDASVAGSELSASPQDVKELLQPDASVFAPRGITATKDGACWTYEDKLKSSGGVVACSFSSSTSQATVLVSSGERTPRAIATSADGAGETTGVYWANFDAASTGGGIFRMPIMGGMPQVSMKQKIASEDYPAGLLVDGETLYWTSRSQGAVLRLRAGETTPTAIATGQQNPGALAMDTEAVYWINEGASDSVAPIGAIMRVAKN